MSSFSKTIFLEKILVLCCCEGKAKDNLFKQMRKKSQYMCVCNYFAIIINAKNKNNGSVRDYTLKYWTKREAKTKKIPLDQRWQRWPKKDQNGCYFYWIHLALTCSNSTVETLEQVSPILKINNKDINDMKTLSNSYWRRSGVFIFNFELISHLGLVFLLLTLNR